MPQTPQNRTALYSGCSNPNVVNKLPAFEVMAITLEEPTVHFCSIKLNGLLSNFEKIAMDLSSRPELDTIQFKY